MVCPPNIETDFRRRARRLPTPLAKKFDPEAWQAAYSQQTAPTYDDAKLLEAALWVRHEFEAISDTLGDCLKPLAPADAVILGVARINLEYLASNKREQAARAAMPEDMLVAFDHWAHPRLENDFGQRLTAGDFLEAAVDALEPWLFDAKRLPLEESTDVDPLKVVADAVDFYTMRGVLKHLFDKALHLGKGLRDGSATDWVPRDDDLAALTQAWFGRAEATFSTPLVDLRERWSDMSPAERRRIGMRRTVLEARRSSKGPTFKVGRIEYLSKRLHARDIELAGLREGPISAFLDQEMPAAPGLTIALLLDVWAVLTDISRSLMRSLPRSADGMITANDMAGEVQRSAVQAAVATALAISPAVADAALTFLTFTERGSTRDEGGEKGNRGLWSAPLIPVPGADTILLLLAVFETGSPNYRVEAWLEKGGIDDSQVDARGDQYERSYRRLMTFHVGRNRMFRTARVAPDGIASSDDFPHQTDLAFTLGDRLFVGELKFFLTPADPHTWDRFFREKLPQAAAQANLRADALRMRPDVIAHLFHLEETAAAKLKVVPIIVVSQGHGFSLEVDGCRVIDGDYLISYLANPTFRASGAMKHGRRVAEEIISLYDSEQEAADRFDEQMADPWSLRRFLDRIEWDDTPYPRPTGGKFTIRTPFRGNLTPTEIRRKRRVLAAIGEL